MTLETLFKKRRTNYTKSLLKYGRVIFNDHFVLLFFILIGAGGFAYSEYLDRMVPGMIEPRLLLALLFFLVTTTGRTTLLLEPADKIFLLPKEEGFKKVFRQLVSRSYVTSLLSVAVVSVLTFPILVTTMQAETIDLAFIFLALAGLKGLNVLANISPFFESNEAAQQKSQRIVTLIKLGGIIGLLFVQLKITALLIIGLAVYKGYPFLSGKLFEHQLFNWEIMIDAEEQRLQQVYRFIGLFANVPNIETNIKRLAWLDGLLNRLSQRNPTASYYYVLRLATRNTEYSLMVIRATIVGAILLAVTQSLVISAVIVVLFLYMIGFQLLTLANEVRRVPLFQIYPISSQEKKQAVYQLIFQMLLVVSLLLAVAAVSGVGRIGFALAIVGFVFAYLFSYLYAPKRLKVEY